MGSGHLPQWHPPFSLASIGVNGEAPRRRDRLEQLKRTPCNRTFCKELPVVGTLDRPLIDGCSQTGVE